jgi:glycine/D-amino acid oxidase-like deaminating enzyme
MTEQYTRHLHGVVVIGAGVIGAAVAYALAREGRQVWLLDRSEPGIGGASFGNVGHLAAELVEPLPSRALLWGFWRKLFALGGPLDIPLHRVPELLPWVRQFAVASHCQAQNTSRLAPLVRPAVADVKRWLAEIERPELLRANGHYEVWFGARAQERAQAQADVMQRLEIPTHPADTAWLRTISPSRAAAGLHFTSTGHVLDPQEVVRACAEAARRHGTRFIRTEVRGLQIQDSGVTVLMADGVMRSSAVVVCAGAWSAPLLEPLGVAVPMEGVRGYHLELPDHAARAEAPILYSDEHVLVTPMRGRLRASSFMDFVELDAGADPRKRARLVASLKRLGYRCDNAGPAWWGPRPVLPDYLPAMGRVDGTNVFYAMGHQHIGLTLAPVTGELLADLVAGRTPRLDLSAFDLRRFGGSNSRQIR